jgi:hypothetical protein
VSSRAAAPAPRGNGHTTEPAAQRYRFFTDNTAPAPRAAGLADAVLAGSGFSWADAGIGAAGTLALLLTLAGSLVALRRRRRLVF